MKFFSHSNGHDFEIDIQPDRDRLIVKCNGREIPETIRIAIIADS